MFASRSRCGKTSMILTWSTIQFPPERIPDRPSARIFFMSGAKFFERIGARVHSERGTVQMPCFRHREPMKYGEARKTFHQVRFHVMLSHARALASR